MKKVNWKKLICKKGHCPKLSQIWQGPFVVKSKLSDWNYVITDENGTKVTVHINNLKSCLNNATKRGESVREADQRVIESHKSLGTIFCTILQIC